MNKLLPGKFLSGFVSLQGRPNVGKSTLMNRLTGEKISITSPKPQTTRNRIRSVLTGEDYQIVFIDTPGLHKPKTKLGEYMVKCAEATLDEVDVVLYIIEPNARIFEIDVRLAAKLKKLKTAKFLIINKIDLVKKEELLKVIDAFRALCDFEEIIPISAATGENVDLLLEKIISYLPEGPKYFPDDVLTDQPERQIVSELIREKALQLLEDEIPHGIAVEIESMKKRKGKELVDVEAVIYCERDSHKGIVIGKNGAMLKEIGMRARSGAERLLGSPVNLQMWVKVKKNWRDSDMVLKNFGYDGKFQ